MTCTVSDLSGNPASCQFTMTVIPCTIACPANQTAVTGAGATQCGKIVSYPAPAITGGCGTVSCSPASGTFFPVGVTTVNCTTAGPGCSFTMTVTDNTPPVFPAGCHSPIIIAAPATCSFSTSASVSYVPPAPGDNCSGAAVACVPPSGSIFQVGTTTVTCTATDTAGNTATCTFPVTVFSLCLQDDSNRGNVVMVNATTGENRFCCSGVLLASGIGTRSGNGCIVTIQQTIGNRSVLIKVDASARKGTANIQVGQTQCSILDRDITNNTCICP